MTTNEATVAAPEHIEEPRFARWLFASTGRITWLWLVVRLWLGWEWFQAGWAKTFGGALTWKVWDWSSASYSLTGDGNIGWVRSGTVETASGPTHLAVGDSVSRFAQNAIENKSQGSHPDVAYGWYVDFLHWVRDSAHTVLGPAVAIGELILGVALILGLFTGIAAFLGAVLNFSYVFAGSAGINPLMILAAGILILAWRNAGWIGLDRFVLPRLGTPWQPGEVFQHDATRPAEHDAPVPVG